MIEQNSMIHVKDLSFGYAPQGLAEPALVKVNLEVKRGEFLGVIGPNGGGKSTLLKLILGLYQAQAGEVLVQGQSPSKARRHLGYVPQQHRLDQEAPATALDVVLSGCLSRSAWGLFYGSRFRKAAMEAMDRTGCADLAGRPISAMSGGQRQRVMIARALVNAPELLLMDEPTTGIDSRTEEELAELLSALNKEVTLMVVTHDLAFLTGRMTRVACLNRGISCFHVKDMNQEKLHELYLENTHALLKKHGYKNASTDDEQLEGEASASKQVRERVT